MKSIKEKRISRAIDILFAGMEDDEMKEILHMAWTGKIDEQKLKEIDEVREENLKYFQERYENVNDVALVGDTAIEVTNEENVATSSSS